MAVKVTVLMPVYNTEETYLKEAISSILEQTFKDFEFIIINDGSTNNAKDIILSYNDNRIIYVENEQNIGVVKSLNKGLDISNGEYIVRMDSDDISNPKRLEISVKFMDENKNIGAAGSHARATPIKYKYETPRENKIIKPFLRYIANCLIHPSVIIRKSVLLENKLKYNEKYIHCEDYKLWIELNKKSKLANIPEVLLTHRIYNNAVSIKFATMQQHITFKIIWENILEDFAKHNFVIKNIIKKYFDKNKISFLEMCFLIFFMKKIVILIQKMFTDEYKSYINNTYRQHLINFLNATPASKNLVLLLSISDIMSIIGFDDASKTKLSEKIIEKAKKEKMEKN